MKTKMITDFQERLLKILKKEKGRILSLDIGKHAFKIAFLSLSKEKAELLKYAIKEFGVKERRDEDRLLGEFIRNFIATNSITEKDIVISLQDQDVLIIKRISLPSLPEREMKDAIGWAVKDELPFGLTEAQIDWQIIGEHTDKEGAKKKDVILACAKRELIDKYVRVAKSAGLNVVDVKTPPFNFSYVLEGVEPLKKGSVSVLDIGATGSALSVYKDGKLTFLRNLPFSSEQITASMSGVLVSDKGRIELTRESAEDIKREFGIPLDANQTLKDDIKAGQIMPLIRPDLERLISEIGKSVDYYTTSFAAETPRTLYITGGGANLKGLDAYLKDSLKFDINKLPLSEIITTAQGTDKDMAQLASAIGAGLGSRKRPHLLPQEYRAEKVEEVEKISLRVTGIIIGVIFLFSLFAVKGQVRDYRNRLKNARLHLQTIGEIGNLKESIIQRLALVKRIETDKIPADWILKELSNLIPDNALLKNLELDQESDRLVLNGYVISKGEKAQYELTAFMENLEASPFFKEATLHSSDKGQYEGKDVLNFEVWCDLAR